jgi:hypothetical protein
MSLLNGQMPEVGSPEYFAMIQGIPAQQAARAAEIKARFTPIVKAAGLNPDTYDYANIQPEIFDKLGSQNGRALQLSTMDYGNQERVNDFGAYTNAANKAISGGLTDQAMWADYDANKYRMSDFQNLMRTGIKGGLAVMGGMARADMLGYGTLGGETAAMAPNQVGAMTAAPTGGGSITGGMWANPIANPMSAVGAGDLTLAASGGLEGLGAMAGGGGLLSAAEAAALSDSFGASAAAPLEIGSAATNAATAAGAPMANAAGLNGTSILNGAKIGGGLMGTIGNALKPVTSGISAINDLTGGNLGAIVGGLAGAAASGDTTTSAQKDPWGPAQSYLKDNLAQNKRMQDYYSANPFSQEQKTAYQGLLNTNANGLSNGGNYNQIANNFMGSNRGLMGQMPTLNTGVNAPNVDWTKYANIGKGG